jgi:hypothetical protein
MFIDSMEYRLSKFKNDIANQFGHNVFYNNVLIRVFYYLLEKRINTRILFLMTTYRRVLNYTFCMHDMTRSCLCQSIAKVMFRSYQLIKVMSKSYQN